MTTEHFANERIERHKFIMDTIGLGNIIDRFLVDSGHEDGAEIHNVTDTGIIVVQNAITKKIITELIARPAQLKRLYEAVGKKAPRKVMRLAYAHNIDNYNNK